MGRFYKTSSAQMLDFTLKLPEELMIKTVQFNDQMIGQELNTYDQYLKAAVGQGFGKIDEARMKELMKEYNDRITQGIDQLSKNPLGWRDNVADIRKIGTDLYNDKTFGEWGKLQGNYDALIKHNADLDEYSKKNPDKFTPEDMSKLKMYEYQKWKGTNWDPIKRTGNDFSGENPAEYVDIGKMLDLEGAGFKADSNTTYNVTPDGNYIKSTKNGTERVSPQEVYTALNNYAYSDTKTMAYLRQRYTVDKALGIIDDADYILKDSNGELLKDFNGNVITPKDGTGIENYIKSSIYRATIPPTLKYSYSKTESGVTSLVETTEHKEAVKWQYAKQKYNLEHGISNDFLGGTTNLKIFDPENFNAEGVQNSINMANADIKNTTNQIAILEKQLVKATGNQKAQIQYQIDELQGQLESSQQLLANYKNIGAQANLATEKNLIKLGYTPDEIAMYKARYKDGDKINSDAAKVAIAYAKVLTPKNNINRGLYANSEDDLVETVRQFNNVSEERAKEMIANAAYAKSFNMIKKDYGKAQSSWYNGNQDKNTYQMANVDLSGLKNDTQFVNNIHNALISGEGTYIADDVLDADGTSYNTNYKKQGFWRKIFTKERPFTFAGFENETGGNFNDYATIMDVRTVGNNTVYDIQVDPHKANARFTGIDGKPFIVSIKFDKSKGIGEYTRNYIQKNYTPATQQANINLQTLGNGALVNVSNTAQLYAKNIPIDYTTPIYKSKTPFTFDFGNVKQEVTVIKDNNNISYGVTYKDANNNVIPVYDEKGDKQNQAVYSNNQFEGSALMEMAKDLEDYQRAQQNLPPISIPDYNTFLNNINEATTNITATKEIIQ